MTAPKAVAIVPTEDLLQTLVESDRRFTLHRVVFDLYSAVFPARVLATRRRLISDCGMAWSPAFFPA